MSEIKRNWTALVREHERSGLSVKDFCAGKHMSVSAFYQHRKKVSEAPTFLPALISDSSEDHKVILRKGEVTIEIPLTASTTVITALLATLSEVPC